MRPVAKGSVPIDVVGNEIIFSDYSRSRRYLIDRIGEYCSYCERKIQSNLAVEHVQPKSINPLLKYKWSNFLLACTNCNSIKGAHDITLVDYTWPDMHDTYNYFLYDNSGIVKVNPSITEPSLILRIDNTIKLVGLDRYPPNIGTSDWERASDRRFEHRIKALNEAYRYSNDYSSSSIEIKQLLLPLLKTIVEHQGFWTIWMNAFENYPEVQLAFIDSMPGTNFSIRPLPT